MNPDKYEFRLPSEAMTNGYTGIGLRTPDNIDSIMCGENISNYLECTGKIVSTIEMGSISIDPDRILTDAYDTSFADLIKGGCMLNIGINNDDESDIFYILCEQEK